MRRAFSLRIALALAVQTLALPYEPLAPCSRRTQLVISEIMYAPALHQDGLNLAFVELYNSNPWYEDISGWRLDGDIHFTFPPNTIIPGTNFLVVAAAPADLRAAYGITNVAGPYTKTLKQASRIQLKTDLDAILLEVPYDSRLPWPAGAVGTGHSIVLSRPSYGEGDPRAWTISDHAGGSPGRPDSVTTSPLRAVVINEFLVHPDAAHSGYVELYNHSTTPVDLSGCALVAASTGAAYVIPTNTSIPAGGFQAFDQTTLGFLPDPAGDVLLLKNPDASRVLDAVSFEAQGLNTPFGRWPDGADDFYPLSTPTPAAANSAIMIGQVVINEVMYKPISGDDDDQYLELYNQGTNAVDLAGWRFTAGLDFQFTQGTVIGPGQYLVLARNATNLFAHYSNLSAVNTVGNFTGKLPHKGGRVALARPDSVLIPNGAGGWAAQPIAVVEDEVTYDVGGRWGQWAHGGGSSLELIHPNTNHRLADNWADSDESAKSSWTQLQFTGPLDNGRNYSNGRVDLVQAGLLDVGECLLDNLEVWKGASGPNLLLNGDFESGATGWRMQGDHVRSSIETAAGLGGYQSSQSLHVRSSDGIWVGANSVQGTLTNTTLASGQTATLRLVGRWLHGSPEVLMRVHGNWIELTGALPVPANLGTPGARNSRAADQPGPAIYEVTHSPAIPRANQPVVVTARFHDPGHFQAYLLYRIDTAANPNPSYRSLPMVDDGASGDAIAGDGLYSATIPAQASGTVVAFLVQARNDAGGTNVFPNDPHDNAGYPRECLVRFGDIIPNGSFGHYHLWLTQNWIKRWAGFQGLANENNDATFVDGGGRIIYNIVGRFAGSPYHQYTGSPVTTLGGMHWTMPDDDKMLGSTSFNKQHVPGNGPLDDTTLQREQTSFWMARQLGLPWDYRRYYILYVNGNRHGPLMEDSQVPGGDMLKEYFPNDNGGFLYKNNIWFEFDVGGTVFDNDGGCTLNSYTTVINGVRQNKLARYRWNYWVRQYTDSANNYTNVYALINAANLPTSSPAYFPSMEALVDTEEWLRMSAIEHATGDWDSFITQSSWNMYCYKPLKGKWTLLKWDWNITLGNSGSWGPDGGNLFAVSGGDPRMNAFFNYPPYMRAYLRAFKEIAGGPMNTNNVNRVLDAKFAAFKANGLTASPYNVAEPGAAGLKRWINTMHNSLLSALNTRGLTNVPFAVNRPVTAAQGGATVTVTGSAPLEVKTITINGASYPLTWTTVKNWSITVPFAQASNGMTFQGYDLAGRALANATAAALVTDPTLRLQAQLGSDDRAQIAVSGQAARNYILQTSADLVTWTNLLATNSTAASFLWTDPAGLAPRRFYRVSSH